MGEYFVHSEQMTVGYDGKPLIRDIEIRLNRGEILTLIGPNGAGKSTILKSLTRQLKLVEGTVYLDQKLMSQMSGKEVAQKLAVVTTERIRPELMTCEDIVATGRYPYTGTLGILSEGDWEKVHKAMEMVHALDFKDRDFTEISDGQRQRILLARAICQEPEVIVLDEPTSFLDIRHKLELLSILKKMVLEHHTAVLMSLHELDLAQKISDYVICVHGDRIEKYGTPEEIFTSEYIHHLYGITTGSYNASFGCLEMGAPAGKPQVFVIGGNGRGIPAYRKLQRAGIPFIAGVIHSNDLDYDVAKALAAEVISEEPFEAVTEEHLEKAEKMKVCTCLNPLHTALAVFGCLLGYKKISEEMKDRDLVSLLRRIGYEEGLPAVTDPGILDPREFLDTVLTVRFPNPFLPDSPQRIATDTSQKLSIRFGETIKAYEASPDLHTEDLKLIPLVYAGWLRYLMGIDDEGREFTPSSDPLLEEARQYVADYELSFSPKDLSKLDALLANEKIFGVNLHAIGMDTPVKQYFAELSSGVGAVATALKKYVPEKVTL